MSEFLSPDQAREKYNLWIDPTTKQSEVERELRKAGVAAIEIPLSSNDFKRLSEGFAVCIEECPEWLRGTAMKLDDRYGNEVGYVRKEKKIDERTNQQTADPKNYFHFSEGIRPRWRDQFANAPKILRDFLADGYEIQDALIGVARDHIADLDSSGHRNMSKLYFPAGDSLSFLRLLRYDGYDPTDITSEVAKPHFDISGVTIQAYADAPGFWGAKDGVQGVRQHYDTAEGQAYTFFGKGHEKLYGPNYPLQPLWHGVDRIIPAGVTWVPERTAVILFVDAPEVDYHMRSDDTLPHLARQVAKPALVGAGI